MNAFLKTSFPDEEFSRIAGDLVRHIAEREQFQNWDECVFALAAELWERRDTLCGFPEGIFFLARFQKAVTKEMKSFPKFKVSINEETLAEETRQITIQNFYSDFDGRAVAYAFVDFVYSRLPFEKWHVALKAVVKALTDIMAREHGCYALPLFRAELQGHALKALRNARYMVCLN